MNTIEKNIKELLKKADHELDNACTKSAFEHLGNYERKLLNERIIYLKGIVEVLENCIDNKDNMLKTLEKRYTETNEYGILWLCQKREKYNLTQKELAEKSGINLYTIQNLEQGTRKGNLETWNKLNSFFESLDKIQKSKP